MPLQEPAAHEPRRRALARERPSARPSPSTDAPAAANGAKAARARLAAEGLLESDVDPALWASVLASPNPSVEVARVIPEVRAGTKVLRRRLHELGAKLRSVPNTAPREVVEGWEARYFDLRTRFREDLGPEVRAGLGGDLRALDAEVSHWRAMAAPQRAPR